MPIDLKNLPSLIAIPYSETLKKDSIQRKDFQRITLENALSLNAVISLSNYFEQNRPSEEDTKKDKFPELKNFDLGQISVGTWNMFSRETTRSMGTNPKALFLNNIYDMYHGNLAKEWDNLSSTLITIRNKDAHGELIPADKLGAELDKRQEILDKFVSMLDFYKDYKLIVPTSTTLENGKVVYNCRDFYGITPDNVSITNVNEDLELLNVYLYSKGKILNLSPMLIAYPDKNNSQEISLYLYSKTSNKSKGNLHYLSLSSSLDLISDESVTIGKSKSPKEICQNFAFFRIFVEDKSLHNQKKPAVNFNRVLKNDFISLEDLLEMDLLIKNEGELSADDIKINFKYPEIFALCDADGESLKQKDISQLIEEDLSLDTNEEFKLKLYFKAIDSGQYEFPPINLEYSYEDFQGTLIKPKVEKDGTMINMESSPSLYCTIYDPADPYSLAPVVNVELNGEFGIDDSGIAKKAPYIGEKIKVEILISNKGFGIAKDIDLTVLPPKELKLIAGNPRWNGNINPNQSVTKIYEFECIEPGIQSINIRELIYSNKDGQLFRTPGGAFNFLVRNKPSVKYKWLMEEIWADLNIDDDELQELMVTNKKYSNFLTESEIQTIEVNTKLEVIISSFKEMLDKKGINLIEREINSGIIALAYKTNNCIYAIIDYSIIPNIKIYVKGNLKGQFECQKVEIKEKRGLNLNLSSQSYNLIGLEKSNANNYEVFKGGINNLKALIGRTSSWMENHDYLLHSLKETFVDALGIPSERIGASYQQGVLAGYWLFDENGEKENKSHIQWLGCFFDDQDNLCVYGQITKNDDSEFFLNEFKKIGINIGKYVGTDLPVYEPFDKYSSRFALGIEIFKGKVKNLEQAKQQIQTNLQQIMLKFVQFKNELIIKQFSESSSNQNIKDTIKNIYDFTNQTASDLKKKGIGIGTYFKLHKFESDELHLSYYFAKDFPLDRDEQDIFSIYIKKKKFEIGFRNISDEILSKYEEKIGDKIIIRKHWNKFLINDATETDMIKEFIEYAMYNSGQYAYLPNYYLLKAFVENAWSGGLGLILECLENNNYNVNYDTMVESIKKVSNDWKPNPNEIKSHIRRFKTFRKIFGIEFIYEDKFTESLVAKTEMRDIISKVPKRKKEKEYSEIELAQANLKRIILFLNKSVSNQWMKTLNWNGFYWGKRIIFWIMNPKTSTTYNFSNKLTTIEIRTGVSSETQPIIDKILSMKGTMETLGDMKVVFNEDLSKLGKYGRAWENPPLVTFESDNTFDNVEDYSNIEKINRVVEEFNLIHSTFLPDDFKARTHLEPYNEMEYKTAIQEFERALAAGELVLDEENNETNN